MPLADPAGKASSRVYGLRRSLSPERDSRLGGDGTMAYLAMTLFISLFAFGRDNFGWTDHGGQIQLALASAFIFGIICGYRAKA
jgi:hypothetical protein